MSRDGRNLRLLFRSLTGRDMAFSASTATLVARSRPRLISTALAPAATLRTPSARMAWARIVDVLVPSPTFSPVFSAAWRNIWAPRFSSGSLRSNSFAIVTPSFTEEVRPISSDQDGLGFGTESDTDGIGELSRPRRSFRARLT